MKTRNATNKETTKGRLIRKTISKEPGRNPRMTRTSRRSSKVETVLDSSETSSTNEVEILQNGRSRHLTDDVKKSPQPKQTRSRTINKQTFPTKVTSVQKVKLAHSKNLKNKKKGSERLGTTSKNTRNIDEQTPVKSTAPINVSIFDEASNSVLYTSFRTAKTSTPVNGTGKKQEKRLTRSSLLFNDKLLLRGGIKIRNIENNQSMKQNTKRQKIDKKPTPSRTDITKSKTVEKSKNHGKQTKDKKVTKNATKKLWTESKQDMKSRLRSNSFGNIPPEAFDDFEKQRRAKRTIEEATEKNPIQKKTIQQDVKEPEPLKKQKESRSLLNRKPPAVLTKPLQNVGNIISNAETRLRKRKLQNYLESSLETSTPNTKLKNSESKNFELKNSESNNLELKNFGTKIFELKNSEFKNFELKNPELNASKVPVYRQQISSKPDSSKRDMYEFISDSGELLGGKKRGKYKKRQKNTVTKFKKGDKNIVACSNPKLISHKKEAAVMVKDNTKTIENVTVNAPREVECTNKKHEIFDQSRINLISDVVINQNNEEVHDGEEIPNLSPPWRFDDPDLVIVPHYIQLKKSALPRVSQDPVMDHTIVDKLPEKSLIAVESGAKYKQKQITDYMQGDHRALASANESSLFDEHQFSPMKSINEPDARKSTRRVLGEKYENNTPSQTPQVARNLLAEFNFHSDNSSVLNDVRDKENRPFRVSLTGCNKKYQKKLQPPQKKKNKPAEKVWNGCSSDESESEEDIDPLKLFDDFDCNTKRCIEFEDLNATVEKLKKRNQNRKSRKARTKKADVWTKKEAEEAEKWATQFNSMCEEVEKHQLEIE